MPLLFDEDYSKLKDRDLSYEESEQQRFFIFTQYQLPSGLYTVGTCDVLVVIPANYNQAGNDMFWTFPRLYRTDGKQIPAVLTPPAAITASGRTGNFVGGHVIGSLARASGVPARMTSSPYIAVLIGHFGIRMLNE